MSWGKNQVGDWWCCCFLIHPDVFINTTTAMVQHFIKHGCPFLCFMYGFKKISAHVYWCLGNWACSCWILNLHRWRILRRPLALTIIIFADWTTQPPTQNGVAVKRFYFFRSFLSCSSFRLVYSFFSCGVLLGPFFSKSNGLWLVLSGASQIIPQVDLFVIQKETNKTSMDVFLRFKRQ